MNDAHLTRVLVATAVVVVILVCRLLRRSVSSRGTTDFVEEFERLNRRNAVSGRLSESVGDGPAEGGSSELGCADVELVQPENSEDQVDVEEIEDVGGEKCRAEAIVAQDLTVPEAETVCQALSAAGIPFAVGQQNVDSSYHRYGNGGMGTTMYVIVGTENLGRASKIAAAQLKILP